MLTMWPMQILYPCLWLGVIGAGGVASGVNPALTVPELKHHITITSTKFLIIHKTCCKRKAITQAAAECQIQADAVLNFDDDLADFSSTPLKTKPRSPSIEHNCGPCTDLKSLLTGEEEWRTVQEHELRDRPVVHATTSGTTGLPKAAVILHQYLVSQSAMLEDQYSSTSRESPQEVTSPLSETSQSHVLTSPRSHNSYAFLSSTPLRAFRPLSFPFDWESQHTFFRAST